MQPAEQPAELKTAFWYPIVTSQEELEQLPESWRSGTDLESFPVWRAKHFEELEAWADTHKVKITVVRTTASYMKHMLRNKPYTVKEITALCNLISQIPGFTEDKIYEKTGDQQ